MLLPAWTTNGNQHAQYTLMAHHQQVLHISVISELSNEAFHAQENA
ncbi:hypothetical protein ACNKHK_04185 [Shigella flexneri]